MGKEGKSFSSEELAAYYNHREKIGSSLDGYYIVMAGSKITAVSSDPALLRSYIREYLSQHKQKAKVYRVPWRAVETPSALERRRLFRD